MMSLKIQTESQRKLFSVENNKVENSYLFSLFGNFLYLILQNETKQSTSK